MESLEQILLLPQIKKLKITQKVKVKMKVGGGRVEPTLFTSGVGEIPK